MIRFESLQHLMGGTRRSTLDGNQMAKRLSRDLAERGAGELYD
jgi:hypothetical protein